MPYKDHAQHLESCRKYYKINSERLKVCRKQHYKDNREEALVYNKQYYKDNRKELLLKKKQYAKEHIEEIKQYRRDNPGIFLKSKQKSYKNMGITRWDMQSWTKVIRKGKNCSYCDNDKDLDSHHLIPKSKQPGLALNENNGIPLCKSCHKEHHMLNGVN